MPDNILMRRQVAHMRRHCPQLTSDNARGARWSEVASRRKGYTDPRMPAATQLPPQLFPERTDCGSLTSTFAFIHAQLVRTQHMLMVMPNTYGADRKQRHIGARFKMLACYAAASRRIYYHLCRTCCFSRNIITFVSQPS